MDEHTMTLLREGLAALGLDTARAEALADYLTRVLEKNRVMNLTAITDPAEAVRLHLLDCAALLPQQDFRDKSVIDVGCGAGFPGLPLRILEPSVRLTLLDATEKKIAFLRETVETMGLDGVTCTAGRAEELSAPGTALRESFDIAVSRAVAPLPILAELCLPFVKKGGYFCAMKAKGAEAELQDAQNAIRLLGGTAAECRAYPIPGTDLRHCAVWIEKTGFTPRPYPRRFSKIKQKPL